MVKVYRDIERGVKALGNLTRMRILRFLSDDFKSVGEIASEFKISQPATSSHLKILCDAGFIEKEKRGNEVYYKLSHVDIDDFQNIVKNFVKGEELIIK